MPERAIWDGFSKTTEVIYLKNCPNLTCDYWLITHFVLKLTAGNCKSASGKLKNNTVKGAMSITVNRVIVS